MLAQKSEVILAFDSLAEGVRAASNGDRPVATGATPSRRTSPGFAILHLGITNNLLRIPSMPLADILAAANLARNTDTAGTPSHGWTSGSAPRGFDLYGGGVRVNW